MSVHTLDQPLARKRKDAGLPSADAARDRIDLRADPAWVARVERQAQRLGLTVSAYIRQATTRQLEQDEASEPERSD